MFLISKLVIAPLILSLTPFRSFAAWRYRRKCYVDQVTHYLRHCFVPCRLGSSPDLLKACRRDTKRDHLALHSILHPIDLHNRSSWLLQRNVDRFAYSRYYDFHAKIPLTAAIFFSTIVQVTYYQGSTRQQICALIPNLCADLILPTIAIKP